MRMAMCGLLAMITLFSVGCHHNTCRNGRGGHRLGGGCPSCGPQGLAGGHHGHGLGHGLGHGHGQLGRGVAAHGMNSGPSHVAPLPHGYMQQQMAGPPGPATPTYAYPYYTTRAPRDFLLDNPPSIGP